MGWLLDAWNEFSVMFAESMGGALVVGGLLGQLLGSPDLANWIPPAMVVAGAGLLILVAMARKAPARLKPGWRLAIIIGLISVVTTALMTVLFIAQQ